MSLRGGGHRHRICAQTGIDITLAARDKYLLSPGPAKVTIARASCITQHLGSAHHG